MKTLERADLKLGAEVIQLLIPNRRPLLMVDGVIAYRNTKPPTLWTRRNISANEDIFSGHFPELPLWPGIYTQEGMGQSCYLLQVICQLQEKWKADGNDPEEILRALRNLELKYRLHPGFRPEASTVLDQFKGVSTWLGMAGSVELRFLLPVFAGQCIEYCVTRTLALDKMAQFEVEAVVEGKLVAKGKMTSVIGTRS